VLETAKKAGLVGRRRVLDSTALYDAVATMDTVTLIRSAIRGLLAASATDLEGELRGLLALDIYIMFTYKFTVHDVHDSDLGSVRWTG
jgi:hypothetical protein